MQADSFIHNFRSEQNTHSARSRMCNAPFSLGGMTVLRLECAKKPYFVVICLVNSDIIIIAWKTFRTTEIMVNNRKG